MKVSFVLNPNPALLDEHGNVYGPIRTNSFPQAQVTLASMLDKNGYQIEFLDARTIENPSSWKNQLTSQYASPIKYGNRVLTRHFVGNPDEKIAESSKDIDVYVITANFTYEANSIAETIRLLRSHNPKSTILVGGTDASPSERHEFYFRSGADYIGLGDADSSLPEFLSDFRNGTAQGKYPDHLIPSKGKIHAIDLNLLNELGDTRRFSESGGGSILESIAKKGFAAYIEIQRGCNRECDFCYAAQTPFNRLSVDEAKSQIDSFLKSGVGLFMFTDDNTLLRRQSELEDIFNYLREKGTAWEFPNGLEFGLLGTQSKTGEWKPNKNLMDALFWNNGNANDYSGVHRLLFPLEDSLLRQSNLLKLRNDGKNQVLEELIQRNVPYVNLGIMIGNNETAAERRNMQSWLEQFYKKTENTSTKFNYSIFCTMPLPGTPLGRQMHLEGRVKYDIDRHPELCNVFTSVADGNVFTAEQTTEFRRELLQQFGMQQDLGKVSPNYGSRRKSVPITTAFTDRKKSALKRPLKKLAALAASAIIAVGAGMYLSHSKTADIEALAKEIRQGHINQIPAFVLTKGSDIGVEYNSDWFINRATQEANKEIKQRSGINTYFDLSN